MNQEEEVLKIKKSQAYVSFGIEEIAGLEMKNVSLNIRISLRAGIKKDALIKNVTSTMNQVWTNFLF